MILVKYLLMKFMLSFVLSLLALCSSVLASDEINGRVSDVKDAIASRLNGKVYELVGSITYPPRLDASFFVITDETGSLPIYRGQDWPDGNVQRGDKVRLRCEITKLPKSPFGAYYHDVTVLSHDEATARTAEANEAELLKALTEGPSWWTLGKVLTALTILLSLVIATLIWNTMLRRLVERRSRELAEETVARISTELKVFERPRLAVELHDTIAQNLTGISLEIDIARKLLRNVSHEATEHLTTASTTLKSCRAELRNCLWDLRNQALEDPDMTSAIRKTLAPVTNGTPVSIRFNVPRERLSDHTAHAILSIIRELTVNAIRHGAATSIFVAGCIEGNSLLFSVRDNGTGFDPHCYPGVNEGHFGLSGIRERILSFEGDIDIISSPGAGTKVTARLHVPTDEQP